jgi:hypothetical protein
MGTAVALRLYIKGLRGIQGMLVGSKTFRAGSVCPTLTTRAVHGYQGDQSRRIPDQHRGNGWLAVWQNLNIRQFTHGDDGPLASLRQAPRRLIYGHPL